MRSRILALRTRFAGRQTLWRVARNVGWLSVERVVRMLLGLAVGVWVARYLGPTDFGRLNFALSLVVLFEPLRNLGLQGVAVRELVRRPENTGDILGASWLLKLAGGIAVLLVAPLIAYVLRPLDWQIQVMVLIIAIAAVVRSSDVFELLFRATLRAKFMVIPQIIAITVQSAFRVGLILFGASVAFFAGAVLVEAIILGIALFVSYRIAGLVRKRWRFSRSAALALLRQSWPLMFADVFALIFLHIDKIMLGQLVDDRAVGVYSVAVTLSTVPYFAAIALVQSVYPTLIDAHKSGSKPYWDGLRKLGRALVWLGLTLTVIIFSVSDSVVTTLFGETYSESAEILRIHVLSLVLLFMGLLRGPWALIEHKPNIPMITNMLGALSNVILNFALIPAYGPAGAAYATVISYFIACVLAHLLVRDARPLFLLQIEVLFLMPEIRAAATLFRNRIGRK